MNTEPAEQALAYSLGRKPEDHDHPKRRAREAGDRVRIDTSVARFAGSDSSPD